MREEWEFVGRGSDNHPFEIEPGVDVWAHQWYESGPPVQIGESPKGPFLYLNVYALQVDGRRIVFAAADVFKGQYVFYRRT